MVKKNGGRDPDRYLFLRRGIYHYKRRVPESVAPLDKRAPHVRLSLKTSDLAIARIKRDSFEAADNELWASMLAGGDEAKAQAAYTAAVRRAEALGFTYREAADLTASRDIAGIVERIEAVMDERTPRETTRAVLGAVSAPKVKVSRAFKIYVDEIAADEMRGKSKSQRQTWLKVKQRAVNNFIEVVGDLVMTETEREDALKFYRFWLGRVAPKEGSPTHSVSSGNKDVGNMRVLFDEYFRHIGQSNYDNPFAGLSFTEKNPKSRPPFPDDWIKKHFLSRGSLASMNTDARRLLLAMIETGCRPSELCNMPVSNIHLEGPVPYIRIAPSDDDSDPYEIKTTSSIRIIPLVGVSLAVFKKQPEGFPKLFDRHNSVTTAINKYLRENNLRPSDKHSLYSLRHSFEDRMKNGRVDVELRKMLMGHTIDRPKYGSGGELKMWQDELKRIALPFDPSVV